jgi:tetratricopeptide (TPR) repeat protein
MDTPPLEIRQLYEQALAYDQAGDVYNAVKLYKKATKSCPQWFPPFERLGLIYKGRQDWKGALYYNKKAVSLNPANRNAWWDLGIAATALKRWRLARSVWSKFGISQKEARKKGKASVRLKVGQQFEIVEVQLLDPARAMISSIPFPNSDRRFRDIILYDRDISGYYRSKGAKLPVYDELDLHKRSVYQTASCWLHEVGESEVKKLEEMCLEYKLGFEVWSNAQLNTSFANAGKVPEYQTVEGLNIDTGGAWVAIAAKSVKQVRSVLDSWEVICLRSYSDLRVHN